MSSDARYRILPALLLGTLLAAAGPAPGGDDVPAFDGDRALELVRQQCDLGPRTPGSPGIAQLRQLILDTAEAAGLRATTLCFDGVVPVTEDSVTFCNVVVSAGPRGGARLWLAAHYDTRPISDRDPDPARRGEPLPGANDGGSGTAVLLHLMELLGSRPPEHGVDLIFFDGEDGGHAGDPYSYCLGSAQLARTWRDFGNPLAEGEPAGLVLLDMVGQEGLRVPMEMYSLQQAPEWTRHVFERAARLGLDAFVPARGPAVYDDHVPFLQQGVAAVDLIDFDYTYWHTTADTVDKCAAVSLAQVGALVVDLVYRP